MQNKTTREIFKELRKHDESDLPAMMAMYTNAISKLEDDPYSLRIFLDYVELSNKFLYNGVDELGYVYWFMKSKLRVYKLYWVGYIRFEIERRKKRIDDVYMKVIEWLKVKEFSGKEEIVDSLIKDKNAIMDENYMDKEEEIFNKEVLLPLYEGKDVKRCNVYNRENTKINVFYNRDCNEKRDVENSVNKENELNNRNNDKYINSLNDKLDMKNDKLDMKNELNNRNNDKYINSLNDKLDMKNELNNRNNDKYINSLNDELNNRNNDNEKYTDRVDKKKYENFKIGSDSSSCDLNYLTKKMKEINEQTDSLTINIRENSLDDLEKELNNHLNIKSCNKTEKLDIKDENNNLISNKKNEDTNTGINNMKKGINKYTIDENNRELFINDMKIKVPYTTIDENNRELFINDMKIKVPYTTIDENNRELFMNDMKIKVPICELEIGDCGSTLDVDRQITRKNGKSTLECTVVENTLRDLGKDKIVYEERLDEQQNKREFFLFKGRRIMKIGKIGRGGYSVVYQVLVDNVIYAWKQMRVDDQEGLNKCVEEVAILKKIGECPFIIKLVDYEIFGDRVNMLFEYGEIDLQKLMNSRRLDKFYIKYLWKSILEILDFIHQNRIIHRDIKPANFVLVRGAVKLIDFGISKRIRADTTSVINLEKAGTMNYISPEQCVGGKISRSTDVWSAGCILYFMIYNRHVFVCKSIMDIIRNMGEEHPIEYQEADPLAIETMKMCLQYNPRARAKPHELLKHRYLE